MRKSKVAKLSTAQAKRVLILYKTMSQSQVAEEMKISQSAVSMIVRCVTYKWATGLRAA